MRKLTEAAAVLLGGADAGDARGLMQHSSSCPSLWLLPQGALGLDFGGACQELQVLWGADCKWGQAGGCCP